MIRRPPTSTLFPCTTLFRSTTKRVPFRWVAEELFWFLSGDTDERNLRARGVDIWKEWADLEHTSRFGRNEGDLGPVYRSEEHTSELQSRQYLVCRLLLEKQK